MNRPNRREVIGAAFAAAVLRVLNGIPLSALGSRVTPGWVASVMDAQGKLLAQTTGALVDRGGGHRELKFSFPAGTIVGVVEMAEVRHGLATERRLFDPLNVLAGDSLTFTVRLLAKGSRFVPDVEADDVAQAETAAAQREHEERRDRRFGPL